MTYYRLWMKKFIFFVIISCCISIISYVPFSFGLADEAVSSQTSGDIKADVIEAPANPTNLVQPEIIIEDVSVNSKTASEVFGQISVINNSTNIYPDLFFSTEIYEKVVNSDDGSISQHLFSKQEENISFNKTERKLFSFRHSIQNELPRGQYIMAFKVYNNLGTVLAYSTYDLGTLGEDKDFILADRYKSYLLCKNKKCPTLSGPSYYEQDVPVLGMSLLNKSSKNISAQIFVKIFERNIEYSPKPLVDQSIGDCKISGNQEKLVEVNVPNVKKPGSYYVVARLQDESGNTISNILEARYVVEGYSAKIVNVQVSQMQESLLINMDIVGSSDGSKIEGALLNIEISKSNDQNYVYKNQKNINIGPEVVNFQFTFPSIPDNYGDILIAINVSYNGEVLDNANKKFMVNEILKQPIPIVLKNQLQNLNKTEQKENYTLTDISGTKYEDAVNKLVSLNILKGYKDQKFRPDKNITRAEFITAICKVLGSDGSLDENANDLPFEDIKKNHWGLSYIKIGVSKGLLSGYPDKTFKPDNYINYGEVLTILIKLAENCSDTSNYMWPDDYLNKANKLGMIKGIQFTTYQNITRGDAALMIYRVKCIISKVTSL